MLHHSRLDGTPFLEEECPSTEALRSGLARRSPLEWFWRRDGAPFPVEYSVAPAREGRDIVGCVMTFRDISEQRALEEARADGEARIRAILEAVPDLMFRVTRAGRFVDFNAPRSAALYAPPNSFIGRQVDEVLPAAVARGALGAVAEALDEGGVRRFEYGLDMPSGPTRYEGRAVRCTENDALVICRQVSPAPA